MTATYDFHEVHKALFTLANNLLLDLLAGCTTYSAEAHDA